MTDGLFDFEPLRKELAERGQTDWLLELDSACRDAVDRQKHGDLEKWIHAWQQIPDSTEGEFRILDGQVCVGDIGNSNGDNGFGNTFVERSAEMRELMLKFHPWRKGPFCVDGVTIETEWRSDWKWNRLSPHIDFRNRMILDVGCGNGYFGWRMVDCGARMVCGLDPFMLYVMQFEAIRKIMRSSRHLSVRDAARRNFVLPVGDSILRDGLRCFDLTLSMGVLYHHRSPIDHLRTLWSTIRPGGQLLLETLVVEGGENEVLVPEDRYAMMRNVWFIPSIPLLLRWLRRTGFKDARLLDVAPTTTAEQRSTPWMTFASLPDFLDPTDPTRTVEGYPAPLRAMIIATQSK
ncbi:MAG: tRNA 5-methoxyuridine(34)/uridine 5-oxyacetic acid(34) synthase CmoB [Planctomyces sp.]|nr:tRNA 5-methoxyuridine(34)/uridine 5-oxyacetic acid(34) synthase CmoB [Planctomyces sp.]